VHYYAFVESPMPRRADGKWESPYRAWRILWSEEHGTPTLEMSVVRAGGSCPRCGAAFDRVHGSRGAGIAFCVNEHSFLLTG
jgi:hypothetical protein